MAPVNAPEDLGAQSAGQLQDTENDGETREAAPWQSEGWKMMMIVHWC